MSRPRRIPRLASLRLVVPALLFGLLLAGCDETTLTPGLRGTIDGQVLTFEDRAPVAGASITTSPATGAIVTNNDGTFQLRNIPSGSYNISVRKSGFQPSTLSVAVRDDEMTPATILLERDPEATRTDSLTAEIVNWRNRTVSADTTFVDVEYRVQNVGTTPIAAYEVYVRITTDGEPFFQEVQGDSLQPQQADVTTIATFLRDRTAQDVTIDDLWFEGGE